MCFYFPSMLRRTLLIWSRFKQDSYASGSVITSRLISWDMDVSVEVHINEIFMLRKHPSVRNGVTERAPAVWNVSVTSRGGCDRDCTAPGTPLVCGRLYCTRGAHKREQRHCARIYAAQFTALYLEDVQKVHNGTQRVFCDSGTEQMMKAPHASLLSQQPV